MYSVHVYMCCGALFLHIELGCPKKDITEVSFSGSIENGQDTDLSLPVQAQQRNLLEQIQRKNEEGEQRKRALEEKKMQEIEQRKK